MNGVTWPSDSRVSVSFSVWHVGQSSSGLMRLARSEHGKYSRNESTYSQKVKSRSIKEGRVLDLKTSAYPQTEYLTGP